MKRLVAHGLTGCLHWLADSKLLLALEPGQDRALHVVSLHKQLYLNDPRCQASRSRRVDLSCSIHRPSLWLVTRDRNVCLCAPIMLCVDGPKRKRALGTRFCRYCFIQYPDVGAATHLPVALASPTRPGISQLSVSEPFSQLLCGLFICHRK